MKNPLISIIVPVYNVEKYLPYCIESLLQQTYRNIEILLIDDGSKDNSLKICNDYAIRDPRCRVFHQENNGVGSARNLGLLHINGEYISFVDSDDYVNDNFIEVLYSNIISGNYDFAMVNYQNTYKYHCVCTSPVTAGLKLDQRVLMNSLYNRIPANQGEWNDTLFMVICNKLYKKSVIEGIYFSSSTLSEDLEFNNQIFLRTHQAIYVDSKLYFYVQNMNSAVHKSVTKSYINRLMANARCLEEIPKELEEYRAACLMKLYKTIPSTRYIMRHIVDEHISCVIDNIGRQTIKEFVLNKYIPLGLKIIFILFNKIPLSYAFFVWICEVRAHRSN